MSDQIFFSNLNDLRQGLSPSEDDEVSLEYFRRQEPTRDSWYVEDFEGQLNVDVMETEADIIVAATVAGTDPKNLQIFLNDDLLTIRGKREACQEGKGGKYLFKECFWGGFSRSIIMPTEVNPDGIKASLRNGVLTVRLPKLKRSRNIDVEVI